MQGHGIAHEATARNYLYEPIKYVDVRDEDHVCRFALEGVASFVVFPYFAHQSTEAFIGPNVGSHNLEGVEILDPVDTV